MAALDQLGSPVGVRADQFEGGLGGPDQCWSKSGCVAEGTAGLQQLVAQRGIAGQEGPAAEALPKVPLIIVMPLWPKPRPRPPGPSTPSAWASSTSSLAPNCWQRFTRPSMAGLVPSMLNRLSLMTSTRD